MPAALQNERMATTYITRYTNIQGNFTGPLSGHTALSKTVLFSFLLALVGKAAETHPPDARFSLASRAAARLDAGNARAAKALL